MYVCVCVYAASMMAPPYPGMMYQTSQGMVYAAAPTSALQNGVIFSLSQGQLQLQHAAADCGMSSVCCAPACLKSVHPPLNICSCLCVSACRCWHCQFSCALLLFGTGFAIPSYQSGARCCFVCGVSIQRHNVILTTQIFCLVFPFLKTFVNIGLILH